MTFILWNPYYSVRIELWPLVTVLVWRAVLARNRGYSIVVSGPRGPCYHSLFLYCIVDEVGYKSLNTPNGLTWWRHQMETFSALQAICAGNSPVTDEFLAQRPVARGFDVFFDLWLNKQLSKQWWGWWFDTPSRPLWRHCNELGLFVEAGLVTSTREAPK